jgi:hypothetical protein
MPAVEPGAPGADGAVRRRRRVLFGRSGFERFLIGSVAESVMRHARRSVLILPPHGAVGAVGAVGAAAAGAPREEARVPAAMS